MTHISPNLKAILSHERISLTDGGLETAMIFHEGFDLPEFAAFTLLESEAGRAAMNRYMDRFLALAEESGSGFVVDTPTWRSGVFWAGALGRTPEQMVRSSEAAVRYAQSVRDRWDDRVTPIVVNGVVGPAGDGYVIESAYTAEAAEGVHGPQISAMAEIGIDVVTAVTMTHTGEAIGIVRAAKSANLPVIVGFTVETDGNLPNGQSIGSAIEEVDAATGNAPIYFMINCAHPDHFRDALANGDAWLSRIGCIRANASRMSHAELDEAEELDEGNPREFGELNLSLARLLPNLRVLGGCCGTDHRHVGEVSGCVHGSAVAA